MCPIRVEDFLARAGGGHAAGGGKRGRQGSLRVSRQALDLCFSATPCEDKLELSKCHCRPLPTAPPTLRSGGSEGCYDHHLSPHLQLYKICLCSILSLGSPGSQETPVPSAPSPVPTKMGSARSAPPSSPASPEPHKGCLLCHCPQPRAHTPAGQARRLPHPKIPGVGAPEPRGGARWPRAAHCPTPCRDPGLRDQRGLPKMVCGLARFIGSEVTDATEVGGAGRGQTPVSRQGYHVPDNQR